MGTRGPAPKPAHLRILEGNPSKRALPTGSPPLLPPLAVVPQAPATLSAAEREAWNLYAAELVQRRVLTGLDLHVLEVFCASLATWREAVALLRERGEVLVDAGRLTRNPAGRVAAEAWKTIREAGSLLGLDPTSRARLEAHSPAEDDTGNPFADLLGVS